MTAGTKTGTRVSGIQAGDTFLVSWGAPTEPRAYVYGLYDAGGTLFYIGVTVQPQQRIDSHASGGTDAIRERLALPGAYLQVLEVHDDYDWALVRESALIAEHRPSLLNEKPGKLTLRAIALRAARVTEPQRIARQGV